MINIMSTVVTLFIFIAIINAQYDAVDDNTDFVLTCNQENQCQSQTVTCPKYARCDISCTANGACRYVKCDNNIDPLCMMLFNSW